MRTYFTKQNSAPQEEPTVSGKPANDIIDIA